MKKLLFGLSLVIALSFCNVVQADKIADTNLGAQKIKDAFNAINNEKGYYFLEYAPIRNDNFNNAYGVSELCYYNGGEVDLSAYSGNIWMTFCSQPDVPSYYSAYGTGEYYSGKLSYGSNSTFNTANNPQKSHSLSVGSAYLYTQYIVGDLSQQFTDVEVGDALRYLMGYRGGGTGDPDLGLKINGWTNTENNKVLYYLLSINSSKEYWTSTYDPNSYYTEIGNYSVFVLNVLAQPGNRYTQDLLYLANAADPYNEGTGGVPEPATVLLWTLGGMGLAGSSWARQRRGKKPAVS